MIRIDRKEYLDFLVKSKDRQIIKVVSGVRRCGKSTLFEIYKDFLLENGVEKNQIIFLKNIKIKILRNIFLKIIKNKSLWILFLKI